MTKLDAAIAQLVNKSASGDLAALRQLMTLADSTEDQPTDSNETTHMTEVDAKIMESVLKRLEGCSQEGKGEKNQ